MALGRVAADAYRANPPDLGQWAETFDGLARLCTYARGQALDAKHESREFVRLVATIADTAAALRTDAVMAYACSGAAAHDFMVSASEELRRRRGEGQADG